MEKLDYNEYSKQDFNSDAMDRIAQYGHECTIIVSNSYLDNSYLAHCIYGFIKEIILEEFKNIRRDYDLTKQDLEDIKEYEDATNKILPKLTKSDLKNFYNYKGGLLKLKKDISRVYEKSSNKIKTGKSILGSLNHSFAKESILLTGQELTDFTPLPYLTHIGYECLLAIQPKSVGIRRFEEAIFNNFND